MRFKAPIIHTCVLSRTTTVSPIKVSLIKITDDIEFKLVSQPHQFKTYIFYIQDIKGNFEITEIYSQSSGSDIPINKENNTFIVESHFLNSDFGFHILTDMEFKKVSYVSVPYQLHIQASKLLKLKFYEYYEEEIILPGYEYLKFRCFIKNVKEKGIYIVIENPNNIEIDDKTGDREYFHGSGINDIDMTLTFVFDPKTSLPSKGNSQTIETSVMKENGSPSSLPSPVLEESRPPSVLPSPEPSSAPTTPLADTENTPLLIPTTETSNKFSEMFSTIQNYPDVSFFSCDGIEIPSYRCILAFHSEIFKDIFEYQKEFPVKIKSKSFEAKIISAALNFCYGKAESIDGIENQLFEFAKNYGLLELKEACSTYMENNVNPQNVFEYIQIAYSNNFEGLKQKCREVFKNKDQIDSEKLKKLRKEILCDIFYV